MKPYKMLIVEILTINLSFADNLSFVLLKNVTFTIVVSTDIW